MRKSFLVLTSVVAVAIALVLAQFSGVFSYWMLAATLAIGGVAAILFRASIAAWIRATAGDFPLASPWREARPATVTLFGVGLLALAVGVLVDGKY
jgi:hypothetical protein